MSFLRCRVGVECFECRGAGVAYPGEGGGFRVVSVAVSLDVLLNSNVESVATALNHDQRGNRTDAHHGVPVGIVAPFNRHRSPPLSLLPCGGISLRNPRASRTRRRADPSRLSVTDASPCVRGASCRLRGRRYSTAVRSTPATPPTP